jgi:hypothetical protein
MGISDYPYMRAIVTMRVSLWRHEKVVIATQIALRMRRRTQSLQYYESIAMITLEAFIASVRERGRRIP